MYFSHFDTYRVYYVHSFFCPFQYLRQVLVKMIILKVEQIIVIYMYAVHICTNTYKQTHTTTHLPVIYHLQHTTRQFLFCYSNHKANFLLLLFLTENKQQKTCCLAPEQQTLICKTSRIFWVK